MKGQVMEDQVQTIRPAAVAGSFYPGDRQALADNIGALLQQAAAGTPVSLGTGTAPPKAIIVPHAGYIYSGQTAAIAYSHLTRWRTVIKRVILLGPVHRVPVRGLALPDVDAFTTPLGEVKLDKAAIASVSHMQQVVHSYPAHAQEHALEVQLPFLQSVLDDFKLVPLAVGDATPQEVAEVMETLWGGPETMIIVSSDLSHFLPYAVASEVDKSTVRNILGMQGGLTHQQACGGTPVNGLILSAKKHGLHPVLLDLCNSGDTAGDKNRVVGYAAFAFAEDTANA
ncbi:AmmeMemoRadiSam system protein B [Methylotenera sp. G11]|uniref:AmmeMemoRadiSam system protein B n=1 Tax=Methylotenera sp. G11 TaxID=1506585 RepID=UPI000ABFCC59|nr:AmmeMemoRadiSam system protein B [Methylotenera sp. G11]